jgi:hypothetical protein
MMESGRALELEERETLREAGSRPLLLLAFCSLTLLRNLTGPSATEFECRVDGKLSNVRAESGQPRAVELKRRAAFAPRSGDFLT